MRYILFGIIILTFISCRQNESSINTFGKNNIYSIVSNNDSIDVITAPCAVMISPSMEQIDRLKQKDSVGFYVGADDGLYYQSEAQDFLDSLKTKTIQKESKGSLLFKTRSGQKFEMKLDSIFFGIILFNGKSKPKEINMTSIEIEYNAYMKK